MNEETKVSSACCGSREASNRNACSCAPAVLEPIGPSPWILAYIDTPAGKVPQIATRLTFSDTLGSWKARWDIGRMDYKVSPGLYAVGKPDASSPVLVSANYKMSFDSLRKELGGLNLWLLVLDTKGINVWCAAGKGTFGTEELVRRIFSTRLNEVVMHRRLILPQLGAPGISAHEVFKYSGFKVVYGPVRAADLPQFLKAGMKATETMRRVRFGWRDRLVLTPIELVGIKRPAWIVFGLLFLVNLCFYGSDTFYGVLGRTMRDFIPYGGAGLIGTVVVPVLLPMIPGRALSLKGWVLGLLWAGVYLWFLTPSANLLEVASALLLLPPIVSFLAMNFTGSTTYTSLSGVVEEMKFAVPAQIIFAGLGLLLVAVEWTLKAIS